MVEQTAIVVITALVAGALRASKCKNEWIPIVCATVGGAIALTCKYTNIMYADTNWLDCLATGIYSGFSAVGVNQVKKQLDKFKKEETNA